MKKYKDNLFGPGGLSQFLGSKSFIFFNLYYLQDLLVNGDDKAPLSPTHFEIWQEIEDTILIKNYSQRNYICPRGYGKTTTVSIPLVIWCHVYGYKNYTVLASAVLDTAQQFLASIKANIKENPYIIHTFGELIDSRRFTVNSEKIQLTNRSAIQSISASGAIRGKQNELTNKRIELLICDDYQTAEQTRTAEQRENKWRTFNADAKNAMQKDNSTIIAVGTVQHAEDFYSRLEASPSWKTRKEKGVLIDNLDEYFNTGLWGEFHKLLINPKDENSLDTAKEFYLQNKDDMQYPLLWDYWNCLDYALSYYEDKQTFMQEVQNDVSSLGEKKFKTILTESPEIIETHSFTKTVLSVDPAGTHRKGKRHDFYAFCVGSIAESKIIYARKSELYDFEYDDYINHTLFLLRKYPDIQVVSIEKNVYSGADVLKLKEIISQDDELRHRHIEFINLHRTGNKDDRINTIVGVVNLGQVIFNSEDTQAIKHLSDFAGTQYSAFDDYPDVLADCIQRLNEVNTIKPIRITENWFR